MNMSIVLKKYKYSKFSNGSEKINKIVLIGCGTAYNSV